MRFPMLLAASINLTCVAVSQPTGAEKVKPREIKVFDVIGDKARSAQDGWSQTPMPREEPAAKDAPNSGGHSIAEN